MIDLLRRILRSPDGDGGGAGDGGAGDGGAGGGSGDGSGAGDGGGGAATTWLTPFENIQVEHKTYDPVTKAEKIIKISPKDDPNFNKYKTAEEFYKGHRNLVETIGKKGVIVPDEKASPEEVEKYYNAIGRPEKPEGYKIEIPQGLHKSIQITQESIDAYKMLVHKHGIPQKMADGLNRDWLAVQNKIAIENERLELEAVQNATEALQKEWGSKFDAKKSAIAKAMLKAGGEEALNDMGGVDGLANKPSILRALGNLVALISEDSLNTIKIDNGNSGGGSGSGSESPEQALQKIAAMNADSKHPFLDEKHPDHKAALRERDRLYKIAYPGQEA